MAQREDVEVESGAERDDTAEHREPGNQDGLVRFQLV